MKKAKTLETKLRSAIRLIWSRSKERREILKAATIDDPENGKGFSCPICGRDWPLPMAEVDHIEAVGPLNNLDELSAWTKKLFYSPQRAICKLCHRTKTKEDMRKIRAKRKVS